jgi:hypothetical protein
VRAPIGLLGLLAVTALPLGACEHGIDLRGKVAVPAQVQRLFSPQHPGELVVKAQIPGQPDITAQSVILCEPMADERVIEVRHLELACAGDETAMVSAWVLPRKAAEVSCRQSPSPARRFDPEEAAQALASARTAVPVKFAAETSNGCKDASIRFALTLAPR